MARKYFNKARASRGIANIKATKIFPSSTKKIGKMYYEDGCYTMQELADIFDVSVRTISVHCHRYMNNILLNEGTFFQTEYGMMVKDYQNGLSYEDLAKKYNCSKRMANTVVTEFSPCKMKKF